jgi:hypothetical protein
VRVTQSTGQMIAVKDPTSAKCNGGRLRPYTGLMSNFRIEEHPVTQGGYVLPRSMEAG